MGELMQERTTPRTHNYCTPFNDVVFLERRNGQAEISAWGEDVKVDDFVVLDRAFSSEATTMLYRLTHVSYPDPIRAPTHWSGHGERVDRTPEQVKYDEDCVGRHEQYWEPAASLELQPEGGTKK